MARKLPGIGEEDWYGLSAVKVQPIAKEELTSRVRDVDTVVDWLVANFGEDTREVVVSAPSPSVPVTVTYFQITGTPVYLPAGWLFDATDAAGQGVLIIVYGFSQPDELVDLPGIEVITE